MTADKLRNLPFFSQLWQRLEMMPKPKTEESILLRILVQALVTVGIIATDVAAGIPEDSIAISLWAVPLSLVGATWSWFSRRDRNIPVKFCLAIGMLLALFAFLISLVGELNDTRLILAKLLIQLQVLHSFDLPQRKDLGYSMVIGLILLGVAGTISQELTFGPLLLLFLILAIPTLVLDYRSRLGILRPEGAGKKPAGKSKQLKIWEFGPALSAKRFGALLLVIVSLGLGIFAFLPRFPGYQLRTFPVSAPIEYQGKFDGRNIVNPGYVKGGNNQGDGGGAGRNPEQGPGTLNDTFYSGFNTRINQNLRGEMKPQVVMRVRSQAPGFWRVLAFDQYTGQGWEISRNEKVLTLNRPYWSYQFYLNWVRTWNRTKEVIQSYTMVSQMPNLIPALDQPKEIYFPTEEIAVDPEGTLRSPLELREGLTYTVISEVPYRNRSLLGKAGTDYPQNIKKYYLEVPPKIKDQVQKLTKEILAARTRVAKSDKPIDSVYEKALYLAQYLKQNPNYKLQKEPPFLLEDEDLVEAFLFGYKDSPAGEKITGGYPDHFVTVMTIMLRSIGIPARVVGGFEPGEFNPFTGLYIVKNTDAHLMTEVYFPKYGWFPFNPIPGYPLYPPSIEENQTFSALQAFWRWVAGWLPTPVTGFLNTIVGFLVLWIVGAITWFFELFTKGWLGLFTGLIVGISCGFIGWLVWQIWRGWRYRRWLGKLPPIEGIYQEMLKDLSRKGFVKHRSQTPLEYARDLRSHLSVDEAEVIEEVSNAYVRWRYGGEVRNLDQLRQLVGNLRRSFKSLKLHS